MLVFVLSIGGTLLVIVNIDVINLDQVYLNNSVFTLYQST